MNNVILKSISDIKNGKSSCIVVNEDKVVRDILSRGIKPILEMLSEKILCGAFVVDKVVGRAAALVMVYGGVKYCYAINISQGAAKVFADYGIEFEYENISPFIINRTGDGVCPMEEAVKDVTLPKDAVRILIGKIYIEREPAGNGRNELDKVEWLMHSRPCRSCNIGLDSRDEYKHRGVCPVCGKL